LVVQTGERYQGRIWLMVCQCEKAAIAFDVLVEEVSRLKISFLFSKLTTTMATWSDY